MTPNPDDYRHIKLALVRRVLCEGPIGEKRPIHDTALRLSQTCHASDQVDNDDHELCRYGACEAMAFAETRAEIWRALHWFWTDEEPDRPIIRQQSLEVK